MHAETQTGRDGYLEPYNHALGQIDRNFASLKVEYGGDDLAHAVALDLERHARAKLVELNETIELRHRDGLEAAQRIVLQNTGKHLMDEIRAAGNQLLGAERAAVDRGILRQRSAARASITAWICAAAAVLLVVGLCLLLAFRDVRRGRRDRNQLLEMANHDPLTGLLNRAGLMDRLEGALARRPHTTGLLYLDLDGFKRINDTMGHAVGNQVLIAAARCLHSEVRPCDAVARLGGDEFVIVFEGCSGHDALTELTGRIEAHIQTLGVPGTGEFPVGCSIGKSWSALDGRDAARLLEVADHGMYAVKTRSRGKRQPAHALSLTG